MKIHLAQRRALATVVTAAIMISAVAVLGTMIVSWSNSNLFAHQRVLEKSYSDKHNKINEFLVIENIWFRIYPKAVNVTLTNSGTIGLNVTKIELINASKTTEYTFKNIGLAPGKSYSIEKNFQWQTDVPIDVVVTTNRGSIFREQALP